MNLRKLISIDIAIIFVVFILAFYADEKWIILVFVPLFVNRKAIFIRLFLFLLFIINFHNYFEHYQASSLLINRYYKGYIYPKDIFYGNKKAFFETENLNYLIFVKLRDSIVYHSKYLVSGYLEEIESNSNPAAFDQRLFSFQNIVYLQLKVDSIHDISEHSSIKNRIYQFIEIACKNHSDLFKSVLFACLLGDKSFMASKENALFAKSGLSHFFALSGLHIGLILFILWSLLSQITKNFYLRFSVIIIIICIYTYIVGLEAPIFRASLMAFLYLYGKYHNKIIDAVHILLITLFINIVIFPSDMFKLSFYLSYTAVFSIFYFMERFKVFEAIYAEEKGLAHSIKAYIVAVLAPYIGTLPMSFIFFGSIPIASIPNNLIILPILVLLLYGMLLFLFLAMFSSFLASIVGNFIDSILHIVVWCLRQTVEILPLKNFGSGLELLLFFLVFIALLHWTQKRRRFIIYTIMMMACFLFTLKYYIKNEYLHFYSLELGQAQSFFFRYKDKNFLFDAGKDLKKRFQKKNDVLDFLKTMNIDTLDYIFISHEDFDHKGNLQNINGRELYLGQNDSNIQKTYIYDHLVLLHLKNNGFKSDKNDESIVLKLVFGEVSILLTGDIAVKREKRLLDSYKELLQSRIVQVPHHGSKQSSSIEWCRAVQNEISIITVGKNSYGHPDDEIIKRYGASRILRSDKDGFMHFISNGKFIVRIPPILDKVLFQ